MDMLRPALRYIFVSVLYTECIAGIVINLNIVAANFMKWKATKSLHTGDKILSSLAASRSLFLIDVLLGYISPIFYPLVKTQVKSITTVLLVTTFLNCTNLWFATILCVFYCVKITNYSWKFFIFLKIKIPTLVPYFLVASLLISVSSSLPFGWCIYKMQTQDLTNVSVESGNLSKAVVYENSHKMLLMFLISSCPPLLIFLVADGMLLYSLWMHTRRMRSSASGFRSPNLDAHYTAVKSMSLFLVFQVMYFICMSFFFSGIMSRRITAFWINSIAACSPPFLHSLYIISCSSEPKKTLITMFNVGLTVSAGLYRRLINQVERCSAILPNSPTNRF